MRLARGAEASHLDIDNSEGIPLSVAKTRQRR
jgi:hypothetical protein